MKNTICLTNVTIYARAVLPLIQTKVSPAHATPITPNKILQFSWWLR